MAKAKEQGVSEEYKSKTPYADELEWTMKQIYKMDGSIDHLGRIAERIEESLKTVNSNQIQIANGIREIWQYLIMSQTTIDKLFKKRFDNYIDFVKETEEKNKEK